MYIGDYLFHHGLQMRFFIYVSRTVHRHDDIFFLFQPQCIPYLRFAEAVPVSHQRIYHHVSHEPNILVH